jgi:hypothetical protein
MYNAPKSEHNIDNFRYTQFIKSTDSANRCSYHLFHLQMQQLNHVYYQIQTWLGNNLETQEWGWILQNDILEQTTTLLPPPPEELLYRIFCNCKNGCGSSCGCRKLGLQCFSVCGQCNGQACLNASSHPDDFREESEYATI